MSFSPKTGLVYLPAQDNGRYFEQPGKWDPAGFKAMNGDPTKAPLPYNLGVGAIERKAEAYEIPYKGRLLAWDPDRAQAEMGGRVRQLLERRHARDRGQSGVPGHGRRRLHRL